MFRHLVTDSTATQAIYIVQYSAAVNCVVVLSGWRTAVNCVVVLSGCRTAAVYLHSRVQGQGEVHNVQPLGCDGHLADRYVCLLPLKHAYHPSPARCVVSRRVPIGIARQVRHIVTADRVIGANVTPEINCYMDV
jgi:hypothetical protein